MNKLHLFILSIILPLLLSAQENLPVTQDVQVEVLTSELQISSKAQTVRMEITCNSASPGQLLTLDLKDVKGVMLPVSAERDGDALWLIQSPDANTNDIVLAWDTVDETMLQLSPGAWTTPYTIELQIKLSFTNLIDVPNITATQLDVIVRDGSIENLASPTGRGNQISLNNSRE